jgi:UDP-N-acetylmuramate--L-alanine ligase/UDP-N-acetylenolpyruvoylglucosamine reductase
MDIGQILAGMIGGGEMRIHLIGVAGSGMSGIAGLLLALGHKVSGSDKVTTQETERLAGIGLDFKCPQSAENVRGADLVIFSSAIKPGNPEYDEAHNLGLSMVRRAEALAAVMNCKQGIVIAGMHGKTTTSSMSAHVLRTGGLKPSHYVGAEIPILGTNAHWDADGAHFVAEGDESDGTLVLYHPLHSIVLNIEPEHLDHYESLDHIDAVYRQFTEQTAGHVFYCADDPGAVRVCADHPRAISFGENTEADYRYQVVLSRAFLSRFKVFRHGAFLGDFTLNVPGRHNISNAAAVIALATELGVTPEKIAKAFDSFRGARRRFEVIYRSDQFMVVDDYGHHPSEVRATLATARGVGSKRVMVMFQPHRYSRTLALKDEFAVAFKDADHLVVADIYPASEAPIPGVTGQMLVDAVLATGQKNVTYQPDRRRLYLDMGRLLKPGDLIITLGAGDIHEQSRALGQDLARMEELQTVMGDGVLKLYEPMSRHTTMRVGGPAQFWAEPETESGFARLVRHCARNSLPFMLIGRGSNLLVRDGGIRGVVIHPVRGEFARLDANADGTITAGAGVKMKDLAYKAKELGLGGFEWMEGIPGNVGGSLRMNAGAMGAETFDSVVSVRFVDREGVIHERRRDEMEIHYRNVPTLKDNYALSAVFKGQPAPVEQIEQRLDESHQKRRKSQPAASSAGCIFKNPAEIPAGKLIDELGLKNTAIGGARVSKTHGNFIVNDSNATATDILALIAEVREAARRKRGIELETEVQIVGEEKGFHEQP